MGFHFMTMSCTLKHSPMLIFENVCDTFHTFWRKKKISVRLLLTRMHKYTSYAYKTQHLGPEYVKVNCTISICNTNSWQTSPKSLLYVTIRLHMIQLLGIKLCEVSRCNLEEKIVSILSDHSTILLCISRVYFSRDYIFCRGDRYVLAYICAKNLNLIIWHLLHMCYPNKNRFILIFSLLTYCANLCLQFANLCLQFRVIIFRQIFDSALPWAVCCAGVLFI